MGFNFNMSFGKLSSPMTRDGVGSFFFSFLDNIFTDKSKKIQDTTAFVFESPILMTVKKFICDTGSLAKFHYYVNGKIEKEDFLYEISAKPNPFQTWTEFIWQYLFYASSENVYLYNQKGVLYILKPENIFLSEAQKKNFQQILFSDSSKKNIKKGEFKYLENNENKKSLDLENLFIIDNLSGLTGDWFKNTTILNSIKGVIDNSNEAIRSKGKNLFFSQKFIVSGQHDPNDQFTTPLTNKEQLSIENSLLSDKNIHSVKSKVDVNQLISNLKTLGLDDAFNSDFEKVLRLFNIPSDLLGLVKGNNIFSDEKQESLGLFVYYNLMPLLQRLTDTLEIIYNISDLRASFSHVYFNKVFDIKNQQNKAIKLSNLKIAKDLGMDDADLKKEIKLIYSEQ